MLKILTLAACMFAVGQEAVAADRAAPQPAPAAASGHVKAFPGRTEVRAPQADMMRPPAVDRLATPPRTQMLPAIQKVREAGR